MRVRGVRGKLVVAKRVNRPRFRMQRRLAPGRYKVISYQRPCDGNCGTLDPPTDRCARHVHVLVRRPDRGGCAGAPRPPLQDEPQRAPGALSPGRAPARRPALAPFARGHQLVGARRLVGTHAPVRARSGVRERESGEGDAAGGLPPRYRKPRTRRRRAGLARPDDQGLLERRGGHCLQPRRRRGALPARSPGRDAELLRGRLLGECPLQRGGPGALLQPDRQARAEGLARLRPRAPVLDRELPALGVLALFARRRLQDVLQGRLAGDGCRAAGARGRALRARAHARIDGGAHGWEPVAGRMGRETLRGRGAADFPPGSCVAGDPGEQGTEGGRDPRHTPRWARGCAPVWAEHLGQSGPTAPSTTRRALRCRATARTGR